MALTAEELRAAIGGDATTAARLLGVAVALVENYAPEAPEAITDEAVIRVAGWLKGSPASGMYESQRGQRGFRLVRIMNPSALRSSGAAALLLPWREHHAASTATEAAD